MEFISDLDKRLVDVARNCSQKLIRILEYYELEAKFQQNIDIFVRMVFQLELISVYAFLSLSI